MGEAFFHFIDQAVAIAWKQCGKPQVVAEFAAALTDEIEHGEAFVLTGAAQSATELLEIHDVTLSRTEKEDAVDFRDIDALVEDIDDEEKVETAGGQISAECLAGDGIRF